MPPILMRILLIHVVFLHVVIDTVDCYRLSLILDMRKPVWGAGYEFQRKRKDQE